MDPEWEQFVEEPEFQVQSKKKSKKADVKKSVRFPVKQMRALTEALQADKQLNSVELVKIDAEFGEARMRESLIPIFLAIFARVEKEWLAVKEERKEERDITQQLAKYDRLSKGLIREGYDKLTLPVTAKNVQPKEIKLTKQEQVGSYSFSVREKTIFVPGFPSVFQTPKLPHVAPQSTQTLASYDKSDPHRATFDYPFDPFLVACHEVKGDFNIDDYDIVAGRNNICKLFGWLLGAKEAWRIDAELMGNKRKTLFLGRHDLPVVHSDSDIAAQEFEKICGQNDDDSSFHVLFSCELHGGVPGGAPLKMLLICEVDAALPAGTDPTKFTRKPPAPVLPPNAPAIAFADPAIVRVAIPPTGAVPAPAIAVADPAIIRVGPAPPAVAAAAGNAGPAVVDPAIIKVGNVGATAAPGAVVALPGAAVPPPAAAPIPIALPFALPSSAPGILSPNDAPVLDLEQRKQDRAAAVEVPPLHEKAEARVKRTNQPKNVSMVELKSIFEANWTKENNDKMVKHWFQCWLANVSLVVCGIKLSNPDNKISLISAHAFRPGPIQRNPNLPAELAGFEYDDFFFSKAQWPGIETKGLGWKETREKLARARLETLHRLYILLGDLKRKVERSGGKTKRIALIGHPEQGEAHVYRPANANERWTIPPWYQQFYLSKQQQQQQQQQQATAEQTAPAQTSESSQ